MKKKATLNLDKIKLYCILNNIQDWHSVPRCSNCKYFSDCEFNQVAFHCKFTQQDAYTDNIILPHTFQQDDVENIGHLPDVFIFDGCDKWVHE
jgi:hypothetical protein